MAKDNKGKTDKTGKKDIKDAKDAKEKRSVRGIPGAIPAAAACILICAVLLTAVSLIPQSAIAKQSKKSADILVRQPAFTALYNDWSNSIQDNYADTELMEIAYCIDSRRPFTSAVRAEYREVSGEMTAESYRKLVYEGAETNKSYGRYWHGSMVYIRPLLMFLDIDGIRTAVGIAVLILQAAVLWQLWKAGRKSLAACFLISFALIGPWMLFRCLEYSSVFLVMPAAALCVLHLIRTGRTDRAPAVFAVSGVVTCFADFLTTETLTYTVPMLILLLFLIEDGQIRETGAAIKTLFVSGVSWLAGYASMFAVKLLLVLAVCGKSELINSLHAGAERVGGGVNLGNSNIFPEATAGERLSGAIWHNLSALYFTKYDDMNRAGAVIPTIVILIAAFAVIYLFRREMRAAEVIPCCALALLPYLRYLVLSNHAYLHFFFTYRAQMVCIMVLAYLVWEHGLGNIPETVGNNGKKTKKRTKKKSKK